MKIEFAANGRLRLLFDTNILIDYLNQVPLALSEMAACPKPSISIMTWIELLAGGDTDDEPITRLFLERFQVCPLTPAIAEQAVVLRRGSRRKLPDAVIWATAKVEAQILVTRNTRDFPTDDPSIRIPYKI